MLRLFALSFLLATHAYAQVPDEYDASAAQSGWSGNPIPFGIGVRPTYRGSDGFGVASVPSDTLWKAIVSDKGDRMENLDIFGLATFILNDAKYKDIFFFDAVRRDFGLTYFDYEFERYGRTKVALIGHYENRRLTVDDKRLTGLENLSRTLFIGGRLTHEYQAVTLHTALTVDVTRQAAGGIRGDASLIYDWSPAERLRLRPSIGLEVGDGPYNDTYFGISAPEAMASQAVGVGLDAYSAPAGLTALSAGVRADFAITERLGLMGLARFERLAPAAADSPLVDDIGSANQFSAGIALTFRY